MTRASETYRRCIAEVAETFPILRHDARAVVAEAAAYVRDDGRRIVDALADYVAELARDHAQLASENDAHAWLDEGGVDYYVDAY